MINKNLKLIAITITTASLMQVVVAQPVVFSSDQWPKRWGRAMQSQPMNVYKKVTYRQENTRRSSWGNHNEKHRTTYSRTPEYNYKPYSYIQQPRYNAYGQPITTAQVYPVGYQNMYQGAYPYLGGYGLPMAPSLLLEPTQYPNFNSNLNYPRGYTPSLVPGVGFPNSGFMGSQYPW